jgi:hypothetical protein
MAVNPAAHAQRFSPTAQLFTATVRKPVDKLVD